MDEVKDREMETMKICDWKIEGWNIIRMADEVKGREKEKEKMG